MLVLVVLLSVAPYVTRLGFYSDDWAFLGALRFSEDTSLGGLIEGQWAFPNLRVRPLQVAYQAVLYKLFGFDPLGYHLINAAVLATMTMVLYRVLREVQLPRLVAVAVPAVYSLMPNYATDRFWFASFGYGLSMTLYLAGVYADLRGVRSGALLPWKFGALVAFLASGLGYEVVLPLFLLSTLLVWWKARRLWEGGLAGRLGTGGAALYLGSNLLVLAVIALYKAATAHSAGLPPDLDFYLVRLLIGSVATNYASFGLALPEPVFWALRHSTPEVLAAAALAGLVVCGYVLRLTRRDTYPARRFWRRLFAAGVVVFLLGYSVFVFTTRIKFSSTGIANRVAMAGALGVAITLVAAVGWIGALIRRERVRRWWLPGSLAVLCTSGVLIVNALATFWVAAWPRQQAVLAEIEGTLPRLPPHTTLILKGVCPYVGPAIVFETPWDLAGALRVVYQDETIDADVVSGRMTVRPDGLHSFVYPPKSTSPTARFHRFGPHLLLFDHQRRAAVPLRDAPTASAFVKSERVGDCPEGEPGIGIPILNTDRFYAMLEDAGFQPWR